MFGRKDPIPGTPDTMRIVGSRPLVLLSFAALLAATSCEDAPTGPEAALIASEAEAALRVASALPTLPELASTLLDSGRLPAEDAGRLAEARALWIEAAEAGEPVVSIRMREEAYALAAPALARVLDRDELAGVHDRLERWIDLARGALAGDAESDIARVLAAGADLLARAREAEARGDRLDAVRLTLGAADLLLATTPGAVATRLIAEAEQALEAARLAADPEDEERGQAISRAERMLRGARQAVGEGDHARAIRRAYYARQLLTQR